MSLLKLRIVPDPILREKAKKVRAVDKFILELVENMLVTMSHENGVGLAANQVGALNKVAIIQTPEMEKVLVLINPVVLERLGERHVEEGCLSIPGYRGELIRSQAVKLRAQDARGKRYTIKADGLLAQAIEHEIDHLEGTLYIDHLESRDKLYKVGNDPTDVEE